MEKRRGKKIARCGAEEILLSLLLSSALLLLLQSTLHITSSPLFGQQSTGTTSFEALYHQEIGNSKEEKNITTLDPFFTVTPKRMRFCADGAKLNDSPRMKLVFVEERSEVQPQSLQELPFRFNLEQSLKRNHHEDYQIITVPTNFSFLQKLLSIKNVLANRYANDNHSHLLIATSVHALVGSNEKLLIQQLEPHQQLMCSGYPEEDLFNAPFLAFGEKHSVHNLINAMLTKPPHLIADKTLVDTMGNTIGLGIIMHPRTNSREYGPFWTLKSGESSSEVGGGGLGRFYCLFFRRRSSEECIPNSMPHIILFNFNLRVWHEWRMAYNFVVSKYLSAAPSYQRFTTCYKKSDYRIVSSLTTLPHRLERIQDTLNSLFSQHVKPDIIYLNIPRVFSRFTKAVDEVVLKKLQEEFDGKYGVEFMINRLDNDFGPISKLLPTLRRELDPSTIIITVDDDMIFKPTLFGILMERHLNSPGIAFGTSGQLIDLDRGISHVRSAWKWKDGAYAVDIIEAFTGAIYRRDFFDVETLAAIDDACIYTDDIWISAHLAKRGIPRVKISLGWGDTAEFSVNDKISPLRDNNLNGTKRNDHCSQRLLHIFKASWTKTINYCPFDVFPAA